MRQYCYNENAIENKSSGFLAFRFQSCIIVRVEKDDWTIEMIAEKILRLEEKYTNEFNTKKNMLEREYNNKLEEIERNIK